MSQTAPPSDKADKKASSSPVPPDERFWVRYSPHAELPLSSAGSFVTHILVFGLLLLASFLSTLLFQTNRSLPVEAVQLSGGGGDPHARGDNLVNGGEPVENPSNDKQPETTPEDVPPPQINVKPDTPTQPKFDDSQRRIQEDEKASNTFQKLSNRSMTIRLPSGSRSYGKGGSGQGGGLGKGTGSGVGDYTGAGNLTPTQREKRMLRWSMLFNTPNSANYVAQLRGLGAILAVPVREDANGGAEYEIIRELSTTRPAKLLKEDISSIQRLVRWRDENPDSVRGVMSVLRVNVRPSHFDAFMPVELEAKLLRLEIDYLNKTHPGRKEDDIESTKFRISVHGGKYEPEVKEQTLR